MVNSLAKTIVIQCAFQLETGDIGRENSRIAFSVVDFATASTSR
jgi:hypothetical protein